jgi:prepilin-type N-terminal cleavage/methylation domain-containing protein
MKKQQQGGFTIIELMIATLVFSIIMVICLSAFLRVGQLYYKGIYLSKTQEAARNISDEVVSQLRLNGGSPTLNPGTPINGHTVYFFCINNERYSFMSGNEVHTDAESDTNFGLVRDDHSPTQPCLSPTDQAFSSNHAELLGDFMRVVAVGTSPGQSDVLFTPATINSHILWTLHLHIDFGDDDLLDNPAASSATCQGPLIGSQFCATTDVDTSVYPLQ